MDHFGLETAPSSGLMEVLDTMLSVCELVTTRSFAMNGLPQPFCNLPCRFPQARKACAPCRAKHNRKESRACNRKIESSFIPAVPYTRCLEASRVGSRILARELTSVTKEASSTTRTHGLIQISGPITQHERSTSFFGVTALLPPFCLPPTEVSGRESTNGSQAICSNAR